jgi:hypothetical protein
LNYEKGKLTSVTRWIISGYYNKKFAKDTLDSEQVSFYSPFLLYNSSVNSSKKSENISWFAPVPVLYHSYKSVNKESYWNFLAITSYEKSNTAHNLKIYPVFYQDFYEQDAKNYNYTNWFLPLYYWNNTTSTKLVADDISEKKVSESEFSFYSLFWIYTNRNNTNKKWLIPPALAYHSESPSENYTNWLLFISREKSSIKTAFPVLWSVAPSAAARRTSARRSPRRSVALSSSSRTSARSGTAKPTRSSSDYFASWRRSTRS